jgi:hypothetical protein
VVELADLTGAEVPTLRAIHAVSDLLAENVTPGTGNGSAGALLDPPG